MIAFRSRAPFFTIYSKDYNQGDTMSPVDGVDRRQNRFWMSSERSKSKSNKSTSSTPKIMALSSDVFGVTSSCLRSWVQLPSLNLMKFFNLSKHYLRRGYEIFWYELSMDPKVRLSPWLPPVEDEVKLTRNQILWMRFTRLYLVYIHISALLGCYYCLTAKVRFYTYLWALFLAVATGISVTAGNHRLWTHSTYKAKWPLRLVLAIFLTVASQFSILKWVRHHRAHHKYTDTNADPHNSKRGFFFSQIGWICTYPHPEVYKTRRVIDTRDIESDWIIRYQHKFYAPLSLLLCHIIPTIVPWYFWGEDFWMAHVVAYHLRFVYILNGTGLVNSAAHKWGTRPYDKNICPTENWMVSVIAHGEGWHNYHHVFPWDYKCAELGNYPLNPTTAFIDFCAWVGLAYDRKSAPAEIVAKRLQRTGEESHPQHHGGGVCGWNDNDLTKEEIDLVLLTNAKNQ